MHEMSFYSITASTDNPCRKRVSMTAETESLKILITPRIIRKRGPPDKYQNTTKIPNIFRYGVYS